MRILASMFCGWMVWFSFVTWRLTHPEVAALAGIVSVFVCEATIHRAERKGLQRERLQLRQQLNLSSYNISQLQESLSNVQAELHRRDIIGTPCSTRITQASRGSDECAVLCIGRSFQSPRPDVRCNGATSCFPNRTDGCDSTESC